MAPADRITSRLHCKKWSVISTPIYRHTTGVITLEQHRGVFITPSIEREITPQRIRTNIRCIT